MITVWIVSVQDEDGVNHGIHEVFNNEEDADRAVKEIESSSDFIGIKEEFEVK